MDKVKWLWNYTKHYRIWLLISYVLGMLAPLFNIALQTASQRLIDEGVVAGNTEVIIPLVTSMMIIVIIIASRKYLLGIINLYCGQKLTHQHRVKIFNRMQRKDMPFFDKFHKGELMTVLTSDIYTMANIVVNTVASLISTPLMFITGLIYIGMTDWRFLLAVLIVSPLTMAFKGYSQKIQPVLDEQRERVSILSKRTQEAIDANRVIKAFANEQLEIDIFQKNARAVADSAISFTEIWKKYAIPMKLSYSIVPIITLVVGGIFVISGEITIGEYYACDALMYLVTLPMQTFSGTIESLQRFSVTYKRIVEVEEYRPRITNPEMPEESEDRLRGDIEFKGVSLSYDKIQILKNINFHIAAGKTLAIMGETGSGKTSIANLIPRLYDVRKGSILVDGVDIRQWDLKTLRSNIGMATQDVFLFSDTVANNIRYGDTSLADEDVFHFAKTAAVDFTGRMTNGFDTIIGEKGVGLSGGQKQRIALARALAICPSILILDDTTSAVDMETERYIQEQIANLEYPCTKIIIAQRISSVRDADLIIFLKDGEIVEQGTHDELVALKGNYYDIYKIQMGITEGVEQ